MVMNEKNNSETSISKANLNSLNEAQKKNGQKESFPW